jgi:hypothetical protein
MAFLQRFACSGGRCELLIRCCGLILYHPDVLPGRGRTHPALRLFSEMFKLTLLPSMSHELSLASHPSIAVGVLYRLAPTSSSVCRSHDHTFVQPFRNFHRPTHVTGCMQCVPWPTGFS